jgi:phospholipid/cholesterol/gamma-HCH transport system substrate-binding protein
MYAYKKHPAWSRLKLGLLTTLALLLVVTAVLLVDGIQKFFVKTATVYGLFQDVRGLRTGAPVRISGMEIGSVESLSFRQGTKIEVGMSVRRSALNHLKADSEATIMTLGLLGDKYVAIAPGSEQAGPLEPGDTIEGRTPLEIKDIVRMSNRSIGRMGDFIGRMENLLSEVDVEKGTLTNLLRDPGLYRNLKESAQSLSEILAGIRGGDGTLGRLIEDDQLFQNLSDSSKELKTFTQALRESRGTLYMLIHDPSVYERLRSTLETLDRFTHTLSSSSGTVDKLIRDDSLYNNLNVLLSRLTGFLQEIDKGKGTLGVLLQDEEMAQDLKKTLGELAILIQDLKENPEKYFQVTVF